MACKKKGGMKPPKRKQVISMAQPYRPKGGSQRRWDSEEMADLDPMVRFALTPPQWLDRKGRPNMKHPDYVADPQKDYRDYMEWVHSGGGDIAQDYVEQVARDRETMGSPTMSVNPTGDTSRLNQLLVLEELRRRRGRQ